MAFRGLQLTQFRNWPTCTIQFAPRVNIFLGENGQGKTNLLEALYICATGQTFRFGEQKDLIRYGQNQAIIRTRSERSNIVDDIAIQILPVKQTLYLNQKRVSTAALLNCTSVILFSPESLRAIKEGAESRRHLLDEVILSSMANGGRLLQDFRRVLRARNRFLRDAKEAQKALPQIAVEFSSLTELFLKNAVELTWARLIVLRGLEDHLGRIVNELTPGANVEISVDYVISGQRCNEFTKAEIHDILQHRAAELAAAELATGSSLVGPQKHDVTFLYDQKDSRIFCSQGQQRTLILAFKIAQIVYHRSVRQTEPVLLLDDVLSELDFAKRAALIAFLQAIPSQVFITTTDVSLPQALSQADVRVFEIENGHLQKQEV